MRSEIYYESADGALQLYAEASGAKAAPLTVLCLHGLTRNGKDFASLVEHLSRRYRIITADQRGRGRSQWDPDPGNYQLGTYVKDVLHLLDRLELERVALIGTSMGGIMSLLLGVTAPQRVCGIVLNDIGPEVPASGLQRLRESLSAPARIESWTDAAFHVRRANGPAFPDFGERDWDAFARRLFLTDASGDPAPGYDPAILGALSQPLDPAGVAPTLWPLWGQLEGMPMLAIRGALSDILSADILERMAASHTRLRTLTLPDRGHAPMLDEPAAVAAIDEFLGRLEA